MRDRIAGPFCFLSRKHEPQKPYFRGFEKNFKKYSTNVEKTIDIHFLQL